ncbi:TonB family protein [bacterium]|nr:MAG: TonB family protein [bacterium]
MRVISICLALVTLLVFPFAGFAKDDKSEDVILYMGETKIIPVSNPTRVMIGNPAVADVSNVGKKEMNLTPKSVGRTTLVFWDDFGEQSSQVKVYAEDIVTIKERVDVLLEKLQYPEVYTEAVADEGKVFLMGRVKTSQEREKIITTLGDLKNKIVDLLEVKEEEAVVSIDVQVLEIDKDATNKLGFTWPSSLSLYERGSPGIGATGTKFSTLFKILNLQRATSDGTADPFTLKLDMLIQEGKARILSRPNLTCQSGKEAELLVGGEKPTFTTTTTSGGNTSSTVEYKEYGIKLKIKPQVTEKDRIKLGLNVEVSEVGTAETIGPTNAPTAKAYPLTKRNASTELFMDNGQTLAIGGLIKQKSEEDTRKVPFLGDIPVAGALFRQKTTKEGGGATERNTTELFITLTPNIISDKTDKKTSISETKKEPITKEIISIPQTNSKEEPVSGYARIVQGRILDKLVYPNAAKEMGFQGTVKLSLHLSASGELIEAQVKNSSGYSVLDDCALNLAKEIGSYPPFPSAIEQNDIWIDIPIIYRLE